jgi:predicted nucleic acid-binding protein
VIVVDTSVWIDAVRDPASPLARVLDGLIDADVACLALPVRLELLSGLGRRDRDTLRRGFAGIPLVVPTDATWHLVERWIESAADAGQRFAIVDLLIAALANELTGLVWSLDRDFQRMAALGFVQQYSWS